MTSGRKLDPPFPKTLTGRTPSSPEMQYISNHPRIGRPLDADVDYTGTESRALAHFLETEKPTMHELPPVDPDMPDFIATLPRTERGMPIPWFVDPTRTPLDFRVMSGERFMQAIKQRICWVCGKPLGPSMAFVGGPLSAATRSYTDPGSHIACATYAAQHCPYLATPNARASEKAPENTVQIAEETRVEYAERAVVVLVAAGCTFPRPDQRVIRPSGYKRIMWFFEGREATMEECRAAKVAAIRAASNHPRIAEIIPLVNALPLPGMHVNKKKWGWT